MGFKIPKRFSLTGKWVQLAHFNVPYSEIIVSKFCLMLTFFCCPFFSLYIIYFRLYYLVYYNSNHIAGFDCAAVHIIYLYNILCNIFINCRFKYAFQFQFVFTNFAEFSNSCFLKNLEGYGLFISTSS